MHEKLYIEVFPLVSSAVNFNSYTPSFNEFVLRIPNTSFSFSLFDSVNNLNSSSSSALYSNVYLCNDKLSFTVPIIITEPFIILPCVGEITSISGASLSESSYITHCFWSIEVLPALSFAITFIVLIPVLFAIKLKLPDDLRSNVSSK